MKKILAILFFLMIGLGCQAQSNLETDGNYLTGYIKATTPYYYGSIDGVLYVFSGNDPYVLVRFPSSDSRTSFTIPNTVNRIARGAFSGCINLKELTIPSTVYYIGDNAFDGTEIEKFKVQGNDRPGAYAPMAKSEDDPVFIGMDGIQSSSPLNGVNIVVSSEGIHKTMF